MTTGFTRAPPQEPQPMLLKYAREEIGSGHAVPVQPEIAPIPTGTVFAHSKTGIPELIHRQEKKRLHRMYGIPGL